MVLNVPSTALIFISLLHAFVTTSFINMYICSEKGLNKMKPAI